MKTSMKSKISVQNSAKNFDTFRLFLINQDETLKPLNWGGANDTP